MEPNHKSGDQKPEAGCKCATAKTKEVALQRIGWAFIVKDDCGHRDDQEKYKQLPESSSVERLFRDHLMNSAKNHDYLKKTGQLGQYVNRNPAKGVDVSKE